jgi:hypothetical protein
VALAVPVISEAGVAWPLWVKIPLTVALVGVPAFFMGMPFPTGLGILEQRQKESVRLAWSLNAAASLLGSVNAIVRAIYLGLRNTLLIGGLLYLLARLVVLLTRPKEHVALAAAEAAPATANP